MQKNELSIPQQQMLQKNFNTALKVVDDIVLKNYLTELHNFNIVPLDDKIERANFIENTRLFKITEMVYEKDEFASYKFASVLNSLSSVPCTVFIIIDSNGTKTDFYMGIRSLDEDITALSLKRTLEGALKGQFPGIQTQDYLQDDIETLINNIKADNVSAVSCVANSKNDTEHENRSFVQGLEKFVLAMQGEAYTGIILANNTSPEQISSIRKDYENIYSQISPFARPQINRSISTGTNNSVAIGSNESKGFSTSQNKSKTETESESNSSANTGKAIASLAASAAVTALASTGVGAILSLAGAGGVIVGAATDLFGGTKTKSTSTSFGETYGRTESSTSSTSKTDTIGKSESFAQSMNLTMENKNVLNILDKINLQMKRLQEFESLGMWECAAYFLAEKPYTSEIAASTYKALMSGKNSGIEMGAINSWRDYEGKRNISLLKSYILNMRHPVFNYRTALKDINITAGSFVSGNELAIHMGLPRKSVAGFPVVEHADFAKEVVTYSHEKAHKNIVLGKVFNMGVENPNKVTLDCDSLAMHTFITGSTGSGKSNTVYELLNQLAIYNIKFLVVEPAKGEYKNVWGHDKNVNVFGTNPICTPLLKINPFKFPKGIHVFEHIDRLIEIFNVCWPMYAAMPAVLKDAILNAYEVCGWDLDTSINTMGEYYPNFKDVLEQLIKVVDDSSYDIEVKSNYKGSLETRLKSLCNGLNGQIFSEDEIDSSILFDSNVIVDLSRVGSLETKSLIMGILIMRLNEYRMTSAASMNEALKHVTVLEEAHHILKRTSTEQNQEGSNMAGKSVEMLSNAIAEMRTYGEGFIIADQSPNAIDMSAIRNTNTKIIMRLPDESDRRLAGKAAALKDNQLDEIAKLPKGVAVVYQNDWIEPILCKVNKCKKEEKLFTYKQDVIKANKDIANDFKIKMLSLLFKNQRKESVYFNYNSLKETLAKINVSTSIKIESAKILNEYNRTKQLKIWNEPRALADFIGRFLEIKSQLNTIYDYLQKQNKLSSSDSNQDIVNEILNHQLEPLICKKVKNMPDDLKKLVKMNLLLYLSKIS